MGMAAIQVIKTASGALVAANEESAKTVKRFKVGATVSIEAKQMRNGKFFRKWWALAKIAFDIWTETSVMPTHNGEPIAPSFDRFRRDLTILAGHGKPVVNIRGEARWEADSLSWASMDEDTFDQFYSATIDAILQKVLRGRGINEEELRDRVERVMEFA